jgi:hypothetical protein
VTNKAVGLLGRRLPDAETQELFNAAGPARIRRKKDAGNGNQVRLLPILQRATEVFRNCRGRLKMTKTPLNPQDIPSPHDNRVPEAARAQERLRVLADEYENKGRETEDIRERMIRLVGVAVLTMGVIASIPSIGAAKVVAKSVPFWWCAPGLLGALFGAFLLEFAHLNGLVYYRRDLETAINEALGGDSVLHYENGFAKAFYSLRTGDRALRIILIVLLLAIAAIYVGSVILSLGRLRAAYGPGSNAFKTGRTALFVGVYAGLGVFLAYSAYRASLQIEPLYKKAKESYRPNADAEQPQTSPWWVLLVSRPWDIPTKSFFFWGAYLFGIVYSGERNVTKAVIAWACLELFVSQAKYVLNDIYDAAQDSRCIDARGSPFAGINVTGLRLFAVAALIKAFVGILLAYSLLGNELPIAIALFLLLPMQIVYDRARSGFPKGVANSLKDFRSKGDRLIPANSKREVGVASVRLISTTTRRQGVENVTELLSSDNPKAHNRFEWATRTFSLAFVLAIGYAIRLGIPLYLVGFARDLRLFGSLLGWGMALGVAFLMGYWSWEGAWYARRPPKFEQGSDERKNCTEESYAEDVAGFKAHTLWCYRNLETRVARRPSLLRPFALWEVVWVLVLLSGPLLGAWTLEQFLTWRGGWLWPTAGGLLFALAYLLPRVPQTLGAMKYPFLLLLLVYLGAAALGYGPAVLPDAFVFLPSVFAMIFATHYTAGPWKAFDQQYATENLRQILIKMLGFFDSLILPRRPPWK